MCRSHTQWRIQGGAGRGAPYWLDAS